MAQSVFLKCHALREAEGSLRESPERIRQAAVLGILRSRWSLRMTWRIRVLPQDVI